VLEETNVSAETYEDDESQSIHNERVSRTIQQKALDIMKAKGITIGSEQERISLQIFPCMSSSIILPYIFILTI